MAHDFNNLLTVIIGNLQLLERILPDDESLRKKGKTAEHAALRGAELTKRLLAFSRRQVLDPKVLDLNELVSGTHDLLHRTLGETIDIETVLADRLWPTRADPGQLESTLLNLVVNARDAMPEGGKLTIETANTRLDEAYAADHAEVTPGEYVMLAVSDTGTGLAPDVLERAFEPFFTTKEVGKGSGLGLSMIYGFVKQSGGHVKMYSEVGQGTTVKIYLPRAEDVSEEEAPELVPALEEHPAGNEIILVVEDDADVRETAVAILEELGYRVLVAENGPAALALVDEHADVDLMFTDIVMPGGLDGMELARKVRKRRANVKVLYTSGYSENAIIHGGRLDRGVDWIGKPYSKKDLARKIRKVLDRRRG